MGKSKDKQPEKETTHPFTLNVRLGDLVNSVEALNALITEKPNGAPPSARLSMTIAELMLAVQPHLANYGRVMTELRAKYQKMELPEPKPGDAPGGLPEHQAKFDAEMQELLDMEIPLPVGMIPLSVLEREGVRLAGTHLYALRWVLKWDLETVFVAPESSPTAA